MDRRYAWQWWHQKPITGILPKSFTCFLQSAAAISLDRVDVQAGDRRKQARVAPCRCPLGKPNTQHPRLPARHRLLRRFLDPYQPPVTPCQQSCLNPCQYFISQIGVDWLSVLDCLYGLLSVWGVQGRAIVSSVRLKGSADLRGTEKFHGGLT